MTQDLVLGIDFGSSSTIAGVLVGDRIELVPDGGDVVIPSVVYAPDRGALEIGRRAAAHQLTEPQKVLRSVKRVLGVGTDEEIARHYAGSVPYRVDLTGARPLFKLRSGDMAPEQVAAQIIRRVRDLAEARFGAPVTKAVMTMSAAAPAGYRDAVVRAAKIAGVQLVELIAEPIAGTLALDLHRHPGRRRVIVCDFGGGTFDVSAVVQEGLRFSPVAAFGDHYLGGDDLDDALARAIAGGIYKQSRYDMHRDIVRWNELLLRCESAKRQLSSRPEAVVAMRGAYNQDGRARDLSVTVDKAWLDSAWGALLFRARNVVTECLHRAGWQHHHVDLVGLIGGSSLVPMFQAAIAADFGAERILRADAPELAVAQGATLLTARHRGMSSGPTLAA
ncbi:MAG: Hsp70 family protein [Deltaproteobacteria bacterium]|nr:Hsp70 family protein [Deltaproteobacteria bacterium]MCW5804136.1 Hsp70 family protein [Deltaproteobacteria bacterium]